jgi:hypothetical protein
MPSILADTILGHRSSTRGHRLYIPGEYMICARGFLWSVTVGDVTISMDQSRLLSGSKLCMMTNTTTVPWRGSMSLLWKVIFPNALFVYIQNGNRKATYFFDWTARYSSELAYTCRGFQGGVFSRLLVTPCSLTDAHTWRQCCMFEGNFGNPETRLYCVRTYNATFKHP